MTEIRCPMCGKSNPAELEVCQYCQARLKPLVAGSQPGGAAGQDEDIPEWLSSLRPDTGAEQPFEEQPFEEQPEQLPDWLAGEKAGAPGPESTPAAGAPDWLASFRDQGSQEEEGPLEEGQTSWEEPAEEIPRAEEMPDWLKGMRSESSEGFPAEGPEELAGEALEEPSAGAGDESPASTLKDEAQEAEPEWLHRIGPPGEELPPASALPEDEADFLASLRGAETGEVEAEEAEFEPMPEVSQASAAEEPARLPDWLSEVSPPEEEIQPEKIPDWLMEQPEAPAEEPGKEGGAPAWLAAYEETPEAFEAAPPPGEEVSLPEAPGAVVEGTLTSPPAEEVEEEAAPAWLDKLPSAIPDETGETPGEAEGVDVPDWLEAYAATSSEGDVFSPGASEQVPDLTLDWLESEAETPEVEQASQEAAFEELPQPGEAEALAPLALEEEGLPLPIDQGEIPEWLGKPLEEPVAPEEEAPPSEEGTGLAGAELPSWLSAMRPVEMAASAAPVIEESDRPAEESGPLAGLRSVLPGRFEPGKVKAPPAYTVKLQVSETQQAHAALIENLVKSEGEAGKLAARKATGHQVLVLIGVFVLVFLAVLWTVFTGSQAVGLPVYPQEIIDARSLINAVSPNAPVLLAVDYEPGLSGEMEATANGVIDQLMVNGVYLTLVSTSPNGPAQAQRLLQGVNARAGHTYQEFSQYANLGYIPGGAAGLRSFAESPRRMMPYALNAPQDQSTWDLPALSKINSLADFGLVAVITENPYTARTWIEQAGPLLGKTPLVMVVSAQAEPLVRPYYEGLPRQVQGIIAGLAGGAAYENMSGRMSLARKYWDAYSFGISIIVLILVVGSLINLVLALVGNQKRPARGAQR